MALSDNGFKDLVARSRSCRRFDASKPLTRDDVLDLLETARLAPTGNNLQPLRFHVASDPDEVAHLASSHGWAALLKDFNGPADASELPAAYIAICLPAGKDANPINLIDVGIAAQTITLAAAARGLGACMIKSFKPKINEDLGVAAKGYAVSLLVALGWPAADEQVRIEPAGGEHGLAYWRTDGHVQHVPKLALADLLI